MNKETDKEKEKYIPIRFNNIMRDCGINSITALERLYNTKQSENSTVALTHTEDE